MTILGVSYGFHDAAASLIDNDGIILFAGHAERYSKKKHDKNLNPGLIKDALSFSNSPLEIVAYYENPWLKKTRQAYSGQWADFFDLDNINIRKQLQEQTNCVVGKNCKFKYYGHHLSHAAAGFQTSPFADATVVVIDAIGEWDTITIWDAEYDRNGKAQYKKVWGAKYPNSIGLFYSAMTDRVGLRPLDEEYILMGMAAYGLPMYTKDLMDTFWDINGKNIIRMKENLHAGTSWRSNELMEEQDNYDIAASSQQVLEFVVGHIMAHARVSCKSKNLVYMGGVALNCVANSKIAKNWSDIWIMPNPGDAGSSLGAAALAYGKRLRWESPYLGYNIPGQYPEVELLKELLEGNIVGVANGRAEFGPRALGNRSLLADPRGKHIKDKVNEIKRRQKFRPFAPMILEEKADEYFEMPATFEFTPNPDNSDYVLLHGIKLFRNRTKLSSPYMQYTAKCKHPKDFPAIVHADGTSRVQTVGPNDNPEIRSLLKMWEYYTGCPMLLNTSLNIRGEPVVNNFQDAKRFEEAYGIKVFTMTEAPPPPTK